LSGFCKREESEYDTFNAGHAGTGVSAAFGMVGAREQFGRKNKVVCVVGDGAMTAGMTLEGLHHAGGLGKDFLVILNDNQMSISKNVGAISAYLSRTITGEFYGKMREETGQLLRRSWPVAPRSLRKGPFSPGCCLKNWVSSIAVPSMDTTLSISFRLWRMC
jgi:1-deoxy-D-xylulose-5-phosphate synthase